MQIERPGHQGSLKEKQERRKQIDGQRQPQSGVVTETTLGFGKGKQMGSPLERNGPHACLSPKRLVPDLRTAGL